MWKATIFSRDGSAEAATGTRATYRMHPITWATSHVKVFCLPGTNKIVEGIKTKDRGSFQDKINYTHMASNPIWNAAEPTDRGGWPTVLQDICGREALAKRGAWSIGDAWAAVCDCLGREGINDIGDFQDFCAQHHQDRVALAQREGLPGPGNTSSSPLGRELDAATVSWIAGKARQETVFDVGTVLREHIGDRITQALDMHRGKGKRDYFYLFPVAQDSGCKGRWAGADDQWTKLW